MVSHEYLVRIFEWIIKWFGLAGAPITSLFLIFLVIFFLYPEKFEKVVTLLHRFLAFISEKHEKMYIAKHIENTIECKRREIEDIMPYKIKIEWANLEDPDFFLDEHTMIIKMKNYKNQSRNLALATKLYVPHALIPKARKYVHPELMKSIDYVISEDILEKDPIALKFFKEMIGDDIKGHEKTIEQLKSIHAQGLLTRVLLQEYGSLAKFSPMEPNNNIHNETVELKNRVYALVTKSPGKDVDPSFRGNYIKVAIVPVAKPEKVIQQGLDPHINFIRTHKEEFDVFYIIAAGSNCSLAKLLVKRCEEELKLKKIKEWKYRGLYRGQSMKCYVAKILSTKHSSVGKESSAA